MDLKISKQVAKESAKEITKLRNKIKDDKEVHISLLYDTVKDFKEQNHFAKKIIFILCISILLSLVGILYMNINSNRKLNELIETIELQYYTKCQNCNNIIVKKEEYDEN